MHELIVTKFDAQYYIAITEHKKLKHFFLEDRSHHSLVGHIFYGTVVRVIAGTQSAFIEIGQDRTAFLHVKDCVGIAPDTKISQVLSVGQNILVQVMKDPIGTKGARLTTNITLPSTYLVYQPYNQHNGISQQIVDPQERARLSEWMVKKEAKGLIVRTLTEHVSEIFLEKDYEYLKDTWSNIRTQALQIKAPSCLWSDHALSLKILRDYGKLKFSKIYTNCAKEYNSLVQFANQFPFPDQTPDIILQSERQTIFSQYKIGTQFFSAMSREVPLKSGGSLVIEQTESMITIDINTSGFLGKKNARDTVLKTNKEAVEIIAEQIPLRELGGIIIIDFIDMDLEEDRNYIYDYLQEKFRNDIMPIQILPMSSIGLIQMTRKKNTESALQKYIQKCPCCHTRSTIIAPYAFRALFIEHMERQCVIANTIIVISARQDVINVIQSQEELWKEHFRLENTFWKYESIPGHHNTLNINCYPVE